MRRSASVASFALSPASPAVDGAPRYELRASLGEGGMGRVFRVYDRVAGEERALKRMRDASPREGFALQAFEREYRVLARLAHPRIIRVYDYGVDAEGRFYTMELIGGQDMRELAPLPSTRVCSYLRDVATSLALLHARRLVHRDLSPSNVRATPDGHCKLLDFGALADYGRSLVIIGTPPFIAPEALRKAPLDQRVDLYALGALAYWMLTRRHAFPAREVMELPEVWRHSPLPPSRFADGIPPELDELVLDLLRGDPLARPGSAAEVISRLNVIGQLPAEDASEINLLAQSFLRTPPFTGRAQEQAQLEQRLAQAARGEGCSLRIVSPSGMGRTRMLDEIGVAAQLSGAFVLRADAHVHRSTSGVVRALVLELLDRLPMERPRPGTHLAQVLEGLGPEVQARLLLLARHAPEPARPPAGAHSPPVSSKRSTLSSIEAWFASVSSARPLVVQVDGIELADDASLGFLASLAKLAPVHRLLLMLGERSDGAERQALGLDALRGQAIALTLRPLDTQAMHELVQSLFGDAPNRERFAEWLYGHSAGSPLHALELCRQLTQSQVLIYSEGSWTLPVELPDAALPRELSEALRGRTSALGDGARELGERLALARDLPSFELCRRLSGASGESGTRALLDELVHGDVLIAERGGYAFASDALRQAWLDGLTDKRREAHHRRLGEALADQASSDPARRMEAGWHLLRGGADARGAELIASVATDGVVLRHLAANMHEIGEPFEAALIVFARSRRSLHERVPLLSGLAQAGYYEDRIWGERYGDAAVDALEQLSGLGAARELSRWLGGWLALIIGMLGAYLRYLALPRSQRPCSFPQILVHLFGTVTSLTGVAALSFDRERAAKVAQVLEPFRVLPERLTPRGIYDFCSALQEIGGDNLGAASRKFELCIQRFGDRRYYPTLPDDARKLYLAGAHFAHASFSMLRARGSTALESADALDQLGYELYSLIASQVRFLFYAIRADHQQAAPHREQVELHAARMGSVWQVETWEAIALSTINKVLLTDVVGTARLAHRIEAISRRVASLRHYRQLVEDNLILIQRDARHVARVAEHYEAQPPHSFLGWSTSLGLVARGFNQIGDHARAKSICERVQAHMTDADREFVALYSIVDIEMALADAGLGATAEAKGRLMDLVRRFEDCDHALFHGLLQEALAMVAWYARDREEFARHRLRMESLFRPTGVPALIAKCDRLQEVDWSKDRRPSDATLLQVATAVEAQLVTAGITLSDKVDFNDAMAALDTIATES